MPVLKVKNNGVWEEISNGSGGSGGSVNGGNADTLDGKHASYFAPASDVNELQTLVGDESVSSQIDNALAGVLHEVLTSENYGTSLPSAGTPGRIFFKKV